MSSPNPPKKTSRAREKRGRGRPPGPSAQGEATRRELLEHALAVIAERGYEDATLREIAARAGVVPTNVYHYFPGKPAIARALYESLSEVYAADAMPAPVRGAAPGGWVERCVTATERALELLAPHRDPLRSMLGVLLADAEHGLLADAMSPARERVRAVFREAVRGSDDAPLPSRVEPFARSAYLAHLALLLFWTLDRTPGQGATAALLAEVRRAATPIDVAIRVAYTLPRVRRLEARVAEALGLR